MGFGGREDEFSSSGTESKLNKRSSVYLLGDGRLDSCFILIWLTGEALLLKAGSTLGVCFSSLERPVGRVADFVVFE
jgi:hypothetical protein